MDDDHSHSSVSARSRPSRPSSSVELPSCSLDSAGRVSLEHLRNLFESAPDGIIVSEVSGRILEVNAQIESLFGYGREELIGESIEKLVPERYRVRHLSHRDAYRFAPKSRPMDTGLEMFGLRKDGSEFPVEISLSPVESEKGKMVCSIIRNASERAAAQKARRRAQFENTLLGLSAAFINVPADRFDEEITNGLHVLSDALQTERATLGVIEAASGDILVTHNWARSGFPRFDKRIVKGELPWLEQRSRMGQVTAIERPEALPVGAAKERAYMDSLGIKSSLIVPFHVAGKVIGGLSVDSFQMQQQWDEFTIARVKDVADIFANALARKQADQSLQQAYSEIQSLKEQLELENRYLRDEIKLEHSHSTVIGNSAAIRAVLKKAELVARTDTVALVLGETGTGKELIARTIHQWSSRSNRPMVKINCAALPATLIESELFGREKGAYTGALAREIGRFEVAHRSTIFLDEIGDLPLESQSKLLRVLQEGELERLGSSKTIHVDVRVVAATSKNLENMVKEGTFREDLFYRLNVFPILIPPLRERTEDIPALVWHILKDLGKRIGRSVEGVHADTMRDFQVYSWPGNIRELRNVIERHLILNTGPIFRAEIPDLNPPSNRTGRRLDEVESEYVRGVLQSLRWRIRGKGGAADILGLKPTTLEARLKRLGIRRPRY